jgi:outer membrane autotransporter protein
VIYVQTSNGEYGGGEIQNDGIIVNLGPNAYPFDIGEGGVPVASESFDSYLPGIGLPISLSQNPGDLQPIYDDAWDIADAVSTDDGTNIASLVSTYRRAAGALAIQSPSESGYLDIYNNEDGIIFGRVDLHGSNDYGEGDWGYSYFQNTGKWFTLGVNNLQGAGGDEIQNDGLIQTAFGTEGGDVTTFNLDTFYNDAPYYGTGTVSQMDGDILDHVNINANDFYGSAGEGGTSLFALDAFLTGADGEGGGADYFNIDGYVHGTTGIIVNDINPAVSTTANPEGFLVVHAEDGVGTYGGIGGDCYGNFKDYCQYGNAFYIAEQTLNYEAIDGFGTIRDGLYSWFLQERPGTEGDDFSGQGDNFFLVSQLSPDGHDLPGITALAVGIGLDGLDTAAENDSGNTFPLTNGGADLSTTPDGAVTAPGAAASRSAIWGRISGNWTRRDTTITDGVTYDTGTNQNTYGLTAGLEFRPDGGDSGLRLGIYGGYDHGNATFDTFGGSTSASGGAIGGYAQIAKGGWYTDAEVKADFLGINFTSPSVSIDTHGTVFSGQVNTGYRMENGNSFFEPIASFTYSNAVIASATVGPSTITYDNGQSIRAGAGVRVGTTLGKPGSTQTELAITGKVWDEFGGPYTVTIDDGTPLVATQDIAGVFGEVTGRATFYSADRSSSGFAQVGGKFGANATTITAKAGLRKNF